MKISLSFVGPKYFVSFEYLDIFVYLHIFFSLLCYFCLVLFCFVLFYFVLFCLFIVLFFLIYQVLLGDFEMIPDQHNYLLALRGVGRIVDLFLHIGGSKVSLCFFISKYL